MATKLYTMAGTRIFIGSKLPAEKLETTASDYAPVVWQEVDGPVNIGAIDPTQNISEQELINTEWVIKGKGSRNAGVMTNQFVPMALDPGQIALDLASEDKCAPYPIKIERGANCTPEATVTITVATPAVVSWVGHGFQVGQPIVLEATGGTLPTGLTAGDVYYVTAPTTDAFSLAATKGGTAIATTAAGTATAITATAPAVGMTQLFQALIVERTHSGGGNADNYLRTWDFNITGNVIRI